MHARRPATTSADRYYRDIAQTLDVLPERVCRYRLPDLTIVYCNASWAAGHGLVPAEAIGRRLDDLLTSSEAIGLRLQLARLSADSPVVADEVAREAPNAPGQWVDWVDQFLPGAHGEPDEVLAVGRDVTGRHIAELNLAASEARFRDLADRSADVVWRFLLEPVPHFDYMSPSVERILGFPPSYFLDDFSRFLDVLDAEGLELVASALGGERMPERYDLRYRRIDGETVIGETHTTVFLGGVQGVSRDVTELRRLQDELAVLALRDPLTGLANRRLLDEMLTAAIARTERSGAPLAVLVIDLDGFKQVNDTHGHDAGDAVLCETARRLLAAVRGADVIARTGGDEFVVVHEPVGVGSSELVRAITVALREPIRVGQTEVRCSASVGCADTVTAERTPEALLGRADAAMYVAKRERRIARSMMRRPH